ncbi:MAG: hypothetical protein RLY60_1241 [Pseudomonadota bacterium]|jgi:uncharacterized membrane-anchored protein
MIEHPARRALHNEVHARPPEPMQAPVAISHMVMLTDATSREASRAHLMALLHDHHLPVPQAHTNHLRVDLGNWRLRWELHTEFVTWTFMVDAHDGLPNPEEYGMALRLLPQQWFSELPGECLARINLWAKFTQDLSDRDELHQQFREDSLVACQLAEGTATLHTDFQIGPDGCSRMLLRVGQVSQRRLGRMVQRLLEIETYRMMALLGLPVARSAAPSLAQAEQELADLAQAIRSASHDEEAVLLERLTRLAGQVEGLYASQHSRFSASKAYFELVDRRIQDIRESRLPGFQSIGEFMDRRLSPARSTCDWVARRQTALSERVSRMSNLLRTRVDFQQEQSSQALLAAMNKRQGMQLKLQTTVEGLSVAAITYYIAGLMHYVAEGLAAKGWVSDPTMATAWAVPVIALVVWWITRRLHYKVFRPDA